jgi:DMSO/TMAO reductase YedYZ heme-binding membrane subunit
MNGHVLWYFTRGSGAVTLLLLTASLCLGIAGRARLGGSRFPRFGIADLHRNLTLLAIAFLGIHVATTVADTYTPIGIRDAFIPFVSSYRPFWLGLGALACDLLLALVVTSLLRARIGLRLWRRVHWLAYACWPVALFHALGTGSDPRAGWLQVLAIISVGAVLAALAVRLVTAEGDRGVRALFGALAAVVALFGLAWYRTGPGVAGWAAKAGTPATLIKKGTVVVSKVTPRAQLPRSFDATLAGTVSQTSGSNGLVDVHLDGSLRGRVKGTLRLTLEGVPLDEGGVSMTSSGVAFAAAGTQVFQGRIVGLSGNKVAARLSDPSGRSLALTLVVAVNPSSGALSGTVHGALA